MQKVAASRQFTAAKVCGPTPTFGSRRVSGRLLVQAVSLEQVQKARDEFTSIIKKTNCGPILIRVGWHDAGTFSKDSDEGWPKAGGATGSIRFKPEMSHGCNAGLPGGLSLVQPVKDAVPEMSWADLLQLGSVVAIGLAGGPHIPLRLGRADAGTEAECTPEGRLPNAAAPFPDGSATPSDHLRRVFHRMGLSDKDIVALSGAHTMGRAYPSRSGFGKDSTKYTKDGPGTKGGSSWTPEWLKFDNSYFVEIKEQRDAELLVLPTDAAIFEDEGFKPHAELYAVDQAAFFADYVASHLKLSELGVKWDGEPVTLPA